MNKDNLMLIGALGIAALIVLPKLKAKSAPAAATATPKTQNVNNEMWTKLLGGAWTQLIQANGGSGAGATPFIVKNAFTGLFSTSDGKPLYTGDGGEDYMIMNTGLTGTAKDYTTSTGNAADDSAVGNFMASLGL